MSLNLVLIVSIYFLTPTLLMATKKVFDLPALTGQWNSTRCWYGDEPNDKIEFQFEVRLVQGETALEFHYVRGTDGPGDTTKN